MATTTTKSKAAAELRDWPLMENNIAREDLDAVIKFLQQDDPILTQSKNVAAFEEEWSQWLGVKHSVFVNSGSSANQITMAAIRERFGGGEIIVPTLTWISDIASVLQNGFDPVFVDINPRTLGMDTKQVVKKISKKTRAVFLTHILGYNALDNYLLAELKKRNIPLIEDVCESHGATFKGQKLGSFGFASNFSFYYAHHMSTIEGGMVCTDDPDFYEMLRMFRSHGMVRESKSEALKNRYKTEWPDLNPDFIFAFPAYNVRSTEINAVMGRSQLKRLDARNKIRTRNLNCFLDGLDPKTILHRLRARRQLQLRLHPGFARAGPETLGSHRKDIARAKDRIPPRHLRRRQPVAPAVHAPVDAGRIQKVSEGESRPFFRRLHRQLSRAEIGTNQIIVPVAESDIN